MFLVLENGNVTWGTFSAFFDSYSRLTGYVEREREMGSLTCSKSLRDRESNSRQAVRWH